MGDGIAGQQVVGIDLHLYRSVIARVDEQGNEPIALMDGLDLPGTYATRLVSQRRMMMVLADEIASVEVDLHTRLRRLLRARGRRRQRSRSRPL